METNRSTQLFRTCFPMGLRLSGLIARTVLECLHLSPLHCLCCGAVDKMKLTTRSLVLAIV